MTFFCRWDRGLQRDAADGIPFHVEETLKHLVLETTTAQQKGVNSLQSAALVSLTERTVKRVLHLLKFIGWIAEAVIDDPDGRALQDKQP